MARPILGWAGVATAAALVAALVPLPTTAASTAHSAGPESAPDRTRTDRLDVPATIGPDRATGDGVVAELRRTGTDPYRMLAVTWDAGPRIDELGIRVRTRADGSWSGWQRLETDHDGPAAGRTAGTVPLWVGDADGVAVRVRADDGAAPEDLRVVTIDPAAVSGRPEAQPDAGRATGKPTRFPQRPAIVTREQWNADPDLGDKCDKPIYGSTTKAAIVHHTAGTNDYSRSDSAGIVRGIQAYHTKSRGWCDIGYNFLVDRFGRVFEGRDGGIVKPVRGAHSGDFNVNTVGISMMGDFSNARLPRRLRNAMVRLTGWRLGTNYVRPRGRTTMHGRTIGRIAGHRDVMSTSCPGEHGYRWLPRLRGRVAHYLSRFDSRIHQKAKALGRSRTGPVFVGERRVAGGRSTRFNGGTIYWKRATGAHYLPRGPMLRGYAGRGGAGGRLGFLEEDYRKTERGGKARFEHGELRYDKRTKNVTVRYW